MKNVGIIKRRIAICLIFSMCINSFAAIVSDNDGSAFITKAEFDSLKNNFQSQIDSYNQTIDSKIDNAIAAYLSGISRSSELELNNAWGTDKYCTLLEKLDINDITASKFALDWTINAMSVANGDGYGTTQGFCTIKRDIEKNNELFVMKKVAADSYEVRQYTKEATGKLTATGIETTAAGWNTWTAPASERYTWRSIYKAGSLTVPMHVGYDDPAWDSADDNQYAWCATWGARNSIVFSTENTNWRYPVRSKKDLRGTEGSVGPSQFSRANSFTLVGNTSNNTSDFIMMPAEIGSGTTKFFVDIPDSGEVENSKIQAAKPPTCYTQVVGSWGYGDPGSAGVLVSGYEGGYGKGVTDKVSNVPITAWYPRTAPTAFETVKGRGSTTFGTLEYYWWEWYLVPEEVDLTKIKNNLTNLSSSNRTTNDNDLNAGLLVFHNEGTKYKTCEFSIDTTNLSKSFKIGLSKKVFGTNNSDTVRDSGNYIPFTIGSTDYNGWTGLLSGGNITIKADCSNSEYIYLTLKYDNTGSTCKHEIFKLGKSVKVATK